MGSTDAGAGAGDRALLRLAIVGVGLYVATWFVLGLVAPAHDPLRDAISQLFDLGAPPAQRWTLAVVLVATGVVLVAVAGALDRVLPGEGRSGPVLVVVAAVGTAAVAAFPCTAGCPGFGTSTTDTMHVLLAGGGYVGLVLAPLAFAHRLWDTAERRLAVLGLVLGGVATIGFVTRTVVGLDALGGLQQRVFNTAADLWLVAAAVRGLALLDGVRPARAPASSGGVPRPPADPTA